jgi:type I restriction-modification system DNA methylase subunit
MWNMSAPPKIVELVENFKRNIESYKSGKYNETQVRREFIDPFFKALGWDVDNEDGHAELYKDVVHEDAIKIGKTTKAPDYSFRIGGQRKFFVEAKKPSINIKDAPDPSFQLRRYAWTAKLPLSILTDFEELAVFDCRIKPSQADNAGKARILYYTYDQYVEKWDEIEAKFSKKAILQGAFDRYAAKGKKKGTQEVDDEFLAEIEDWRNKLAKNIALRNDVTQRQLNFSVQKIIDRIIFLRICEDRGIEPEEQLKKAVQVKKGIYQELNKIFLKADDRYNSGLFHFKNEKGRSSDPDGLTPFLVIDDKPLKEIIGHLYYPDSPYEFSVFPADILGQVYERFLGKVIQLKGRSAVIEEKPEVKKAGGVFYTPTYIVDYIIENTLGKALEKKSPEDVEKIRVLDPACGSGSFLIQAYQYLMDWHLKWYLTDKEYKLADRVKKEKAGEIRGKKSLKQYHQDKIVETQNGWQLTYSERLKILKNNIFGVDIDVQAIETTKLSLLLKLLEVQSHQLPMTQRVLPDLDSNIKCGNSLIGTDYYQDVQLALTTDDEQFKINAFDWEEQFVNIFSDGGFDVVIGNPPYIFLRNNNIDHCCKEYLKKTYELYKLKPRTDVYFFEKGFNLLKSNGHIGYITPSNILTINSLGLFRTHILTSFNDISIVNCRGEVFKDANVDTMVITMKKTRKPNKIRFFEYLDTNLKVLSSGSQKLFINEASIINYEILASPGILEIIKKIEAASDFLSSKTTISNGLVAYKQNNGNPPQTKGMAENRIYHSRTNTLPPWYPYLGGSDVKRYFKQWSDEYILYGDNLGEPRYSVPFQEEHILVRVIPSQPPYCINAMFIEGGFINDQNYIVLFDFKLDTSLILGILNSKVISYWFVHKLGKMQRGLFPQLKAGELKKFPLPKNISDGDKQTLSNLASAMTNLLKQKPRTEQEKRLHRQKEDLLNKQIDQLLYQIYSLTPDEIALVEAFGKEKP